MGKRPVPGGDAENVTAFRPGSYGKGFYTMFQDVSDYLASVDRPASYFKALFALTRRLDAVDYRKVSAMTVATDCRITKSSAERALALLEADKLIIAQGRGHSKERRLNRNVCWDKSAVDYRLVDEDWGPDPFPVCSITERKWESTPLGAGKAAQ